MRGEGAVGLPHAVGLFGGSLLLTVEGVEDEQAAGDWGTIHWVQAGCCSAVEGVLVGFLRVVGVAGRGELDLLAMGWLLAGAEAGRPPALRPPVPAPAGTAVPERPAAGERVPERDSPGRCAAPAKS